MPPVKVIKANAKVSLLNKWSSAIGIGAIVLSVFCVHIIILNVFTSLFNGILNVFFATLVGVALTVVTLPFFAMPLLYGALRWFWFTANDSDVPVSEIFCFFGSSSEYLRALSLSYRVFFRITSILILCFIPSILIWVVRNPETYNILNFPMPYWTSSMWVLSNIFNFFGWVFSIILLLRYFIAPILMINDRSLSPQEALDLSVIISKSTNGRTFSLLLSFLGWGLLSLLIIPMIYTIPYFLASYAVYCRFLINHYNNKIAQHYMPIF